VDQPGALVAGDPTVLFDLKDVDDGDAEGDEFGEILNLFDGGAERMTGCGGGTADVQPAA